MTPNPEYRALLNWSKLEKYTNIIVLPTETYTT